jgi:P27 family predicted phage terminase small subunit
MGSRGPRSSADLAIVPPQPAGLSPAAAGDTPPAPAHLSEGSAAWWRSVVSDYSLEPHHLRLLQAAAEAWDRMQLAREAVASGGITFRAANGDLKANPAVAIERDARVAFARLIRELDLDADPPAERSRPPALRRNAG